MRISLYAFMHEVCVMYTFTQVCVCLLISSAELQAL